MEFREIQMSVYETAYMRKKHNPQAVKLIS